MKDVSGETQILALFAEALFVVPPFFEAPFVEHPFIEALFVEPPFIEAPFIEHPFVEHPFMEPGIVQSLSIKSSGPPPRPSFEGCLRRNGSGGTVFEGCLRRNANLRFYEAKLERCQEGQN